jgi:two-component system chemotaxis response regulator CheV
MAGSMDNVKHRSHIAGHSSLELLLFHLNGRQRFGINVFKVQEVIQCPPLTEMPQSHPAVIGIATLRGRTIGIVDLRQAIGGRASGDYREQFIIISEYNKQMLGFLVGGVAHIVNLNWEDVLPPPKATGRGSYMTAVTQVEGELVEIIDVEKVMVEVMGEAAELDPDIISTAVLGAEQHALVVDDSSVARHQVQQVLQALGIGCTLCSNGEEALRCLQAWRDEGKNLTEWLAFVLSDVEMPRMDGYTLTTRIRQDPDMQDLHVILHTSLSGMFNEQMVASVGADRFIAKWDPDLLAGVIQEQLQRHAEQAAA